MGGNQPEESPALSSARQAELRPYTSVNETKDNTDSSQPSKGPVDPPTDLKFAPGSALLCFDVPFLACASRMLKRSADSQAWHEG